jgi:hypothetical protein
MLNHCGHCHDRCDKEQAGDHLRTDLHLALRRCSAGARFRAVGCNGLLGAS